MPRAELPEPEEDTYYVFQLVGLAVEEEGGRALGVVADVEPGPANDVLVLDSGLLLPLVEACVLDVDLAARPCRSSPPASPTPANLSRPCGSTSSPWFRMPSRG